MSTISPKTLNSEPPPQPSTVVPYVLCDCCSRIVKKSKIIQALAADRLREYQDADPWNRDRHDEFFFHNRSRSYLWESSAAGCHLCSLAILSFSEQGIDTDPTAGNRQSIVHVEDLRGTLSFRFACKCIDVTEELLNDFDHMDVEAKRLGKQDLNNITALQLQRFTSEDQPKRHSQTAEIPEHDATSVFGPLLSTSTNSPESISTARSWIDHCLQNHPKCDRNPFKTDGTEYRRLPTRLIDVGTADGELAPRLIITSASVALSIKYLTLSHSWSITSTESTLKLTSGNIQHLQKQIPVTGLPRTFQDSMELTRRFGYRYIWIDSLCIMQDSESDWHREALTMSSIYGNSSCNIAALGVDGADTCFVQRNPLQILPCRITQQKDESSVYARRLIDRGKDVPLLSRGWVMQERLLSPRVIYTGDEQLHWECCSRAASEDRPSSAGEERSRWELASSWARFLAAETYCTKSDFELVCGHELYGFEHKTKKVSDGLPRGRKEPAVAFALAWLNIVHHYNSANFTYESDRLIALAGVAKAIEHSRGFTYVAGTWKELWPIDLLWYRDPETSQQELRNPSKSKAPSWSWAAGQFTKTFLLLEDPDYEFIPITYLAQVIEFTSPTSTARYTGTKGDEERITLSLKGGVKRGMVSLDDPASSLIDSRVQVSDGSKDIRVKWDQTPEVGDSVLILLLIKWETTSGSGYLFEGGLVLMLEEGAQNKHGQPYYRRVGSFREYDRDDNNWEEEMVCLC